MQFHLSDAMYSNSHLNWQSNFIKLTTITLMSVSFVIFCYIIILVMPLILALVGTSETFHCNILHILRPFVRNIHIQFDLIWGCASMHVYVFDMCMFTCHKNGHLLVYNFIFDIVPTASINHLSIVRLDPLCSLPCSWNCAFSLWQPYLN